MVVQVSVVLNRTVVVSDLQLETCVIVIFRVKVSCITSVDGTLLVVCHLSSDVVGCKD